MQYGDKGSEARDKGSIRIDINEKGEIVGRKFPLMSKGHNKTDN